MAFFKDVRNRQTTTENIEKTQEEPLKEVTVDKPQPLETDTPNTQFEIEEARYMLKLVADSDFKGRDVQIVYNIALKLQDILKSI